MLTSIALEKSSMSGSIETMADFALFRGVCWIDVDYPALFSDSFIFDEVLQLPKSPFVHPLVVSGFSCPDVCQVFHYNHTIISDSLYDVFADVVVSPCHIPSPSSRDFFKESLTGFCAFGLEFANQSLMLYPFAFDFFTVELSCAGDCDIVYSDINTKNSILESRIFGIDVFGECEYEVASSFLVDSEQTFFNIPRKIFLIAGWNCEGYLDSAFNGADAEYIVFETCTSRKIVSHTNIFDFWLSLCLFEHSTTLLDTSHSELTLQSNISQMLINERMQLDIILDISTPSLINTILKSNPINLECINYLRSDSNLYLSTNPRLHKESENNQIYKSIENIEDRQFLAEMNLCVSLPEAL
jgi:hypothetical protein